MGRAVCGKVSRNHGKVGEEVGKLTGIRDTRMKIAKVNQLGNRLREVESWRKSAMTLITKFQSKLTGKSLKYSALQSRFRAC